MSPLRSGRRKTDVHQTSCDPKTPENHKIITLVHSGAKIGIFLSNIILERGADIMRKTEYDPQAIKSISAFDSHKKQLIALLQKDITGRDMEESSDDTMKYLSKKMKQHIIEGAGCPVDIHFARTEAKRRRA